MLWIRDIPNPTYSCPAESTILLHLNEQWNQFSFRISYDTIMYWYYKITMQLRRLLLPTHKMQLLCILKNWWTHWHGRVMEVQNLQLVIVKQGRSNPLSHNQIAVMLWVPYGGMWESAFGVDRNFCLPLGLIISLFLWDPNLTGISTTSLRHGV